MTQEQRDRISIGRKGIPSYNKGNLKSGIGEKFCESCGSNYKCDTRIGDVRWRKQRFCSKSCALKDNKRTLGMFLGELNPSWKGGITPANALIRSSTAMNEWRKEIFKRDDWTCQICNSRGVPIHADHIKAFSQYPELRTVLSNGRTLCVPCHKQTDNYAGRAGIHT
jgi:hypothetical protein